MSDSPKIYGFGSACVDYRIHIPDMGSNHTSKVMADNIIELGGGACANCLVQAARLGADCTYIGKLGDDHQANTILTLLSSENIKTELIESDPGAISPFNVAVYKGKNNERVGGYLLPNSLKTITSKDAKNLAEKMAEGSIVIVEIGEIPLKAVLAFSKVALKRNIRIFIDVDLDPVKQLNTSIELFESILKCAEAIIPNYEAVKEIYGVFEEAGLASHMSKRLGKTVIVTAGENGVYYCVDGKISVNVPADKINTVDTVGAGDSFHGSLLYSLALNYSLEKSIKFAVQCAQFTCMGFGARASMPYLKDVKQQLL
ncbi:MAG: carbohydrate kinase family protein [Clostridiales bacterium]|nr:carbohydrate kinase family protein [Clostridiales bacterium]